ncbi:sulfite exporter TauE/SafE family protein 3-like [Olea europaea var. sylvestris]|uniref:sulfite exporter TauE/SafE family protein 3-like n=1 Tax=Olea europaea var. sylvestris TaxID=158386 RepID=UPI000C1D6502|nr:sulfite exporter TauE/SafE family protein 3-like [Olea europaea var. sylvestris]
MILGIAVLTVYYNLKLGHPTIDIPIIDYDLVVLVQPMLMLGISIGVAFNVIFANWMVIVLYIGNNDEHGEIQEKEVKRTKMTQSESSGTKVQLSKS